MCFGCPIATLIHSTFSEVSALMKFHSALEVTPLCIKTKELNYYIRIANIGIPHAQDNKRVFVALAVRNN